MIWTALVAMVGAILGQHLGLFEAMSKVALKISKCPKCSTFWVCLSVLLFSGDSPIIAVSLSIVAAYMSYWVGLLLILINRLYNKIWERLQRE